MTTAYDGFRISDKVVTFGSLFLRKVGATISFASYAEAGAILVYPAESGLKTAVQVYRSKKYFPGMEEGRYMFVDQSDQGYLYQHEKHLKAANNFGSTA